GAGERSYGSSRRGRLDLSFRRGRTALTYTEAATTTARDRFRSGLLQPDAQEDYLFVLGRLERYISKALRWSLDLELRRTNLTLTLFDEARGQRAEADGTPPGDETQSGAYVYATWRAGARTELLATGRHVRREFGAGSESDLNLALVGI